MILLTGATGLVGNAIFQEFKNNNNIIGTSFSSSSAGFIKINLLDENKINKLFKEYNFTTIIHCAAIIPSKSKNLSDIEQYQKNIKILTNILANISDKIRFINISSTAIYDLKGKYDLNESSKIQSETFYQLSKQHIEDLLEIFYQKKKNMFLNIRISSPYSVYKASDSILYKFIESAKRNNEINLWGSGERTQAFTNVNSFAQDLKSLIKENIFGTYNYINTSKISMKELAYKIKFYKETLEIRFIDKEDPEDKYRTSINLNKLSKVIKIHNTLDKDIKFILDKTV